ncbi:MAG: hypothetical protein HZB43_02065 [candidate division Zixibacteria bacterium]|nr:hypothetical protein [candidate division Zixibacteria bacterium]
MTHNQPANEFQKRPSRNRRKKSTLAKPPVASDLPVAKDGPAVSVFEIPVGNTGRVAESAFRFGG